MKKVVFGAMYLASFSLASCCCCAGDDEVDAAHGHDSTAVIEETHEEEATIAFDGVESGDYLLYGHTDFKIDGHVTVAEMFNVMETTGSFDSKVVAIKIAEVCQKAGCWITFNDEAGNSVRVFFRDHFTIPIETAAGTDAFLYGSLVMDTLSVDFQKHLLDDAKDAGEEIPQSEYDAITKDKIETTFDCESILVKKAAH